MAVVDGSVIPVPEANREAYTKAVAAVSEMFLEVGAVEVVYAWGADVPEGVLTSFPMAVKREAGEGVVFAWVLWPDSAVREAGWVKAMGDPRMAAMPEGAFDGKRMIYGSFDVIQYMRKE
jgi:uncharacterized protein YbaA (DUF1428 family)